MQPHPPALPKRTSSLSARETAATVADGGGGFAAGTGVAAAKLRAQKEKEASLPQFKRGAALLEDMPDMSISEYVKIKGDLKFETLLRIDGRVEGCVTAPPKAGLIIGETGTLIGNVMGIGCMYVEGKVVGNISVESLTLAKNAVVHGDVSCRSISVVPDATIIGQLHISAFDPLPVVDHEGNIDTTGTARPDLADTERKKVILFIIDPQVDFHDGGSCAVPGAAEDAERIAEMISQNISLIDEIIVTLDTHHRVHIAHPIFWVNAAGESPSPYSAISLTDFETNKWFPRNPEHKNHCQGYLKDLKLKEMSLTIKPEHCLKGSLGHTVVPIINEALQEWAGHRKQRVGYIFKTESCLTDMTSVFTADVKVIGDPTTALDPAIMQHLQTAHKLIVCGQSLSHGIRYSMRDLLQNWHKSPSSIVLLQDGSSPNPNIDPGKFQAENFWGEMAASGVTVLRSAEVFV